MHGHNIFWIISWENPRKAEHTASPRELARNWWIGGLVRAPPKRLKNSSWGDESRPIWKSWFNQMKKDIKISPVNFKVVSQSEVTIVNNQSRERIKLLTKSMCGIWPLFTHNCQWFPNNLSQIFNVRSLQGNLMELIFPTMWGNALQSVSFQI